MSDERSIIIGKREILDRKMINFSNRRRKRNQIRLQTISYLKYYLFVRFNFYFLNGLMVNFDWNTRIKSIRI